MIKADISTIKDIELLVNTFYEKVRTDNTIGYIFNDIIGEDWSSHLPIMYNFWSSILLSTASYSGNPIKTHIDLNKKIQLSEVHFNQWLSLWKETVDELFVGATAILAKQRAESISTLIRIKIADTSNGKSII